MAANHGQKRRLGTFLVAVLVAALSLGVVRRTKLPQTSGAAQPAAAGRAGQDVDEFGVFPPFVWLVLSVFALGTVLSVDARDPLTAFGILAMALSALIATPGLLANAVIERSEERYFERWEAFSAKRTGIASRGDRALHQAQQAAKWTMLVFCGLSVGVTVLATFILPRTEAWDTARSLAFLATFTGVAVSFLVFAAVLAIGAGWRTCVGREGAKYVHYRTATVEEELRREPAGLVGAALLFFIGGTMAFLGAYLP